MSNSNLPGRRIAARTSGRPRAGTVIAVAAPVVTALALLVQSPADTQVDAATHAPTARALSAADLTCPGSAQGPAVLASAAEGPGGSVDWRAPASDARAPVPLAPGGTATVADPRPLLVRGAGELAGGLFGARFHNGRPGAAECATPGGVRWFVGAGAGAAHLSTLTLTNPDAGPAVADVTVWSVGGQLEEIESRGLTIPGGASSSLELEKLAPNADELAVRVVVARGRLTSSMSDAHGEVGGPARTDALAATAAPSRRQLLPALTRKASSRVLTVVNPGRDEARITVSLVGARSTFAPAGVEEIRVPAGRVVVTDLTAALGTALEAEDAALLVESSVPIASGLRATVGDDLVHHPAVPVRAGTSAAVLPPSGGSSVVVTAGEVAAQVTLTWAGAAGDPTVLKLLPGTTEAFDAPAGARFVTVESSTPYAAAVRIAAGNGAAVLPLRPLVTELLVPAVRPAWPPR